MRLTIITINYNDLEGLTKTTRSLVMQSLQDYEWIVIDGGSTDGSKEYLESLERQPDYWCSEPDGGVYPAMNKGIAKASGEYILFMNAGDTFHADSTLEHAMQYDFTEDVVYGDACFLFKKKQGIRVYDETMTLKRLYDYSINHQSTFIKTSLLKEKGYDVNYKIVADAKRFVEMFIEGCSFRHLPMIISDYDTTGVSSTNEEAVCKERERFFKELLPDYTIDVLKDWLRYQNKPCRQTAVYCSESKFFKKLIRANLHFVTWMNGFLHLTNKVK